MKATKTQILIVFSFIAIYIIWGSTYLFNKVAVTELPPFFLASIRFSIAGVLMMLIAKIAGANFKISLKQLKNASIASLFFLILGNSVFVWALQFVDSGFAALIASTQPLFVLLILRFIDRKPMQKKSIVGVTLGILGMYLLISQQELVTSEQTIIGILVMLGCVLGWSYGGVFVSKADLPKNFLVSTGIQMIVAGAVLALISISFKETWSLPTNWSANVQIAMLLLIFLGGIVAFTAFNYLLKVVSTEKVATSAYVNPVIALFMGWYFLDEKISTQSMVASVVLLTGVYFITSRKRR
ncbi:EamA family transporter [uncultured Polaribacter sp.]|uniref:EamA family transporter n=1 Tax=uncultured Polaribacter sp. TaxID=174711 RepID=UPI00260A3870|nr:EamA family transporter [uncultured Polaribacter sp.]